MLAHRNHWVRFNENAYKSKSKLNSRINCELWFFALALFCHSIYLLMVGCCLTWRGQVCGHNRSQCRHPRPRQFIIIIAHICAAHSFPDFVLLFTWAQCWAVIIHRLQSIHSFYDRHGMTPEFLSAARWTISSPSYYISVCWWAIRTVWTFGHSRTENLFFFQTPKFCDVEYLVFSAFSTTYFVICALCVIHECAAHTKRTHTKCTFTGCVLKRLLASHIQHSSKCSATHHHSPQIPPYIVRVMNAILQNVRQSYCIFSIEDVIVVVYSILRSQSILERCVLSIHCLNRAHQMFAHKMWNKNHKKNTTTEYSERVIIP